jgi:hypothetical protein
VVQVVFRCRARVTDLLHSGRRPNQVACLEIEHQVCRLRHCDTHRRTHHECRDYRFIAFHAHRLCKHNQQCDTN